MDWLGSFLAVIVLFYFLYKSNVWFEKLPDRLELRMRQILIDYNYYTIEYSLYNKEYLKAWEDHRNTIAESYERMEIERRIVAADRDRLRAMCDFTGWSIDGEPKVKMYANRRVEFEAELEDIDKKIKEHDAG